jgi:hypothetical protein
MRLVLHSSAAGRRTAVDLLVPRIPLSEKCEVLADSGLSRAHLLLCVELVYSRQTGLSDQSRSASTAAMRGYAPGNAEDVYPTAHRQTL